MAPVQVQGLEELVERQRLVASLAEIDAEETADVAEVQQRKIELTGEAAQAIINGRSAESKAFAKLQVDFGQRQETRRLRREALLQAKATIDAKVTAHLATAIRAFHVEIRARTVGLAQSQMKALEAFLAAREEEVTLQQQALREVGRVHKLLPYLELKPGWSAACRSKVDPDGAIVRHFLDGYIGRAPAGHLVAVDDRDHDGSRVAAAGQGRDTMASAVKPAPTAAPAPSRRPGVIGQVEGIALVYEIVDAFDTVWGRGCIDRTRRERLAAGRIKLFVDHGDFPRSSSTTRAFTSGSSGPWRTSPSRAIGGASA